MITDQDIVKLKKTFTTKKDLERSEEKTARGFLDLQQQINSVKTDVQGLKGDVQGLKGDVQGLKGDVQGLKTDFQELKDYMITMEVNILSAINNLQNENKIVSTYIPKVNNHETRITKLESSIFPTTN